MEDLKEKIIEIIEGLDDDQRVFLYNEYAEVNDYSRIYINNTEFFSYNFINTEEAVRAAIYGNYEFKDHYVIFDGYSNLQSFDCLDDEKSPYGIEALAAWLADHYEVLAENDIECPCDD